MSAWAVKDKTETWDTVCDRALAGEPQFVSRGPSQMVVVISYVDYRPIAPKRRKIVKNPKLAFKISDEDLFSDDSQMWEACDDKVGIIALCPSRSCGSIHHRDGIVTQSHRGDERSSFP